MKEPLIGTIAISMLISGCASKTSGDKSAAQPDRPNVILFLTDDVGFGDLSHHGNPWLHTANIDQFAAEGVQYTNFYVCPACAPTRAGMLTGRYNFRTKNTDVGDTTSYMSPDEITIAEVLRANGYLTGLFGKWHLGENYPLNPGNQGFDEVVFHHFCNITPDFPVGNSNFDPWLFHNGTLERYEGYCMDVYTNEAIGLMEKAVESKKPFFIYLPTTLAHVPLQVPESYYRPFMEKGLSEETSRAYGMMQSIDDNFGRLMHRLDELGIRENTLVIFTSDNGQSSQDLDRYQANLRGLKGFMYEGGVKVPCFMQLPGSEQAPVSVSVPTAYIDIFPTILDICDIAEPAGITIDGRSLKSLALGQEPEFQDRNLFLQWRIDMPMDPFRHIMVRNNRYKLVQEDESGHSKSRLEVYYAWCMDRGYSDFRLDESLDFELYDMTSDPYEQNNIAASNPATVEEMKQSYLAWYHDVFSTRGHNRPVLKLDTAKQDPVYLTSNFWLEPRTWHFVVETPGVYDITVYWGNTGGEVNTLHTEVAGQHYESDISGDEGTYTFRDVPIPEGYHPVQSWINDRHHKCSITTVIQAKK